MSDGTKWTTDLAGVIAALAEQYGNVDGGLDYQETRRATIYIRAAKKPANGCPALGVLRLSLTSEGWRVDSFRPGIPLWDSLRGAHVGVEHVEHS